MSDQRPLDFRALFESAPGLYLVLTPELEIVAVSEAYLRATMTERERILGRGLFDVFPDNPNDPAATGTRNLRASLERVLANRVADAMAMQKYDIRRPESEGGGFEERFWSPLNSPVLDARGEVAWIIHSVEDVTELARLKQQLGAEQKLTEEDRLRLAQEQALRKSAEAALVALKRSEERYRLLFETSPQPMWVVDAETLAIFAANQAAVRRYGWSRAELLGMTIKDLHRPEDVAELVATLALVASARADAPAVGSSKHRTKDVRPIDVEITVSPLTLDGRDARLVVANDVTELRSTEEQLRQAQKMEAIGRLAGGVAHDFNNLMTAVVGYGELVLSTMSERDPARRELEEIKRAGERAASLTRQLLAFSRKQVLQPRVLKLNSVVAEIERMLARLIGEDIDLAVSLDKDLGNAKADPGQLEQVIVNLVVNARDAMPAGGKVTIETRNATLDESYAQSHVGVTPGEYVLLAVTDTGTGMDKETLSHLFEPFFTTKEKGKGTGLGLSTVYGIVKQSGGHVWVYSEPGRGSTFKVYFPRVQEPITTSDVLAAPSTLMGSETVLLAEDEEIVRRLARTILAKHGYSVLEAANPAEAVMLSERYGGTIHLMLSDVVLPEMSGHQLAVKLATARPAMRTLYMSGYTENAIVHQGTLDAGTAFIQKPFTPSALAKKVREVLDARA